MTISDRREAVALFEREYAATTSLLRSLRTEDQERPVFGEGVGWRIRDLPAHWASWQRLAARTAERIAAGTPWPAEGSNLRLFNGITASADELNASTFAAWRERTFAEGIAELAAAHAALMAGIAKLTDPQLFESDSPEGVRRLYWTPGVLHLRTHREHLEAALKEGATTS